MMKKILLLALLIPSLALAQQPDFVRNDNNASTLNGVNLRASSAAVNDKGQMSIGSVSPGTGATDLGKAEDAVAGSGFTGVAALGVTNEALSTLAASNGDYSGLATNQYGAQFADIRYGAQSSATTGILKLEDAAAASGDALVGVAYLAESAIVQQVGATADYGSPKTDLGGRTVTTSAPSGEMVQGCNTAVTTATTGAMIGNVASKFTFITQWNCTNTGAAASRVILEDADGTDLANGFLPATSGFFSISFPSPVRTNVVNKQIQVNVITTGTSTICCASGYTGVI